MYIQDGHKYTDNKSCRNNGGTTINRWGDVYIDGGYKFCFATGLSSLQALSSNRYLLPGASILRSRTRYSLMSSHYCKSCITFIISLSCCSKFGKNSFEIVLYQYIRRYHLISKNGQSKLC
jgi:hypothetical protein